MGDAKDLVTGYDLKAAMDSGPGHFGRVSPPLRAEAGEVNAVDYWIQAYLLTSTSFSSGIIHVLFTFTPAAA